MVHTGVNDEYQMTEYHKFFSEVNLGIPAGYMFFVYQTFFLLIVGQDDKIQMSKLQYI